MEPEGRSPDAVPPSSRTINLLVALLCLLWGSTWLAIREGLRDLPPFTAAGLRFSVAAVVMAGLGRRLGRLEGGKPPPPALWITSGLCNFALSYGIVYWTETKLPSGLVAVLWGIFPLLMAASGHFFLPGERLRRVQWLGFVGGFLGIVLLFATDLQGFGPAGVPAAATLLLSPVLSVAGTTVVKRYGKDTSSLLLNRNSMLLGAILLLGSGYLLEGDVAIEWTPTAVFSVLYLAIAGTVVTFGVYFWLLRYADAHRLGLIAYVTPVVALALGFGIGDETVTWNTVGGAALILSGVVAVLRGRGGLPRR